MVLLVLAAVLSGCWWDNDKRPFEFIAEPLDAIVAVGATATFSVEVKGKAPTYQWRLNGADVPGATGASYTTPVTVAGDDGALFSVVVTSGGRTLTSRNARLTVNAPPTITSQPSNATAAVGTTAAFTVTASGTVPLSYQWRRDGTNIGGATGASYTTPAVTASDDAAVFSVVVSNAAGSVTSANATLTVSVPPTISTQPADTSVSAGVAATFTVVATGTAPLSYQWRRDGVDIGGADASSYATGALTADDNGARFSVLVSNAAGSVDSAEAVLTVTTAPPADNLLYFSANSTGSPQQLWVTDGTPGGTRFVTNWTPPDPSSSSISVSASGRLFARLGSNVYFPAIPPGQIQGSTLWRSDGTAGGTLAVTTALGYVKAPVLPCAGQLFFWARTPTANDLSLYVSDGTAGGTRQVGTVHPGSRYDMVCHENVAYFAGVNTGDGLGEEPWRSDGTDAGTFVLKDLRVGTGSSRPGGFASLNGRLYFGAEVAFGSILVVSDGTEAGTAPASGAQPLPLVDFRAVGTDVYFTGQISSLDLYRVDSGNIVSIVSSAISPRNLTPFGDRLFFFGEATNNLDFEPYLVTGGIPALLTTINPDGTASARIDADSRPFVVAGNRLVFVATTTGTGDEPWVTDGTAQGTQLLKDLVVGSTGSSPYGMVPLGNRVLFRAAANMAGERSWTALWATDGTAEGTLMLTPDGLQIVYY